MSVSIDDLTFGAEFEVIMPRADGRNGDRGRRALAEHLGANGIEAEAEAYNHRLRPHWKITTDASIGYDNAEIVSPILRGDDGLEQVKKLCRLIDDWGCRVNRGCGHHVHVGVRDRRGSPERGTSPTQTSTTRSRATGRWSFASTRGRSTARSPRTGSGSA
jgi:hypothetical protein